MSTIRVSDEVKERLRDLKRDDESFNDLLDRLSRTEKDVEAIANSLGELGGDDFGERTKEAHEELNESLERRTEWSFSTGIYSSNSSNRIRRSSTT